MHPFGNRKSQTPSQNVPFLVINSGFVDLDGGDTVVHLLQ